MKKTFPLTEPGKADARVIESVKSDVRRYVKRERRKQLPEGFDLWVFNCRAGATPETATPCDLSKIGAAIDAVVQAGGNSVYVEILAQPQHRTPPAAAT